MNSFISSQSNYCPLVWMFNSRATNSRLNRTFEKHYGWYAKAVNQSYKRPKEKYGTIYQHNLQLLMAEIFKTKNNLNSIFMGNIFSKREVQYNLRSKNHLQLPNVKTAKYGIENIQQIGHHLWASLPEEIKDSDTLTNFQKIKSSKGSTCFCRLCKVFVNGMSL